ncbi:MAG: type III pantothenate kinase [Candidatus Kapabacteria bacterium]|nr:type III pantothenate kinase [Candidatus Kapabacteria bacterium]
MATVSDTLIELNNVTYGIAAIDVGNSRVKIHHDDVHLSFPYDKEWKKNVQIHFRDHVTRRYLIGLSSVNHKQTTAIVKVLQRIPGHHVLNAHTLLMRNQSELSLEEIENAGIDRMLGAIGALSHVAPPLITIDCGTAVTVNAVSASKHFLGGVIFAGFSTQLFGLAKQTAAIPEMTYTPPSTAIGINTAQCLMSGITMSVVGGLREAITKFTTHMGQKAVPVVITGGESTPVVDVLKSMGLTIEHQPHIVTEGILILLSKATNENLHDSIIGKITT